MEDGIGGESRSGGVRMILFASVSNLSGVLMLHHSWPTSSCTHSVAEHPLRQSCISLYFTAAQRGVLHYYAIWAATKPGPPAEGALPLTQSKEWSDGSKCAESAMYLTGNWALITISTYFALPVWRWCCASTVCSGIPVSTCSVTLAPPQQVGGNSSSSGTSTKVTRPFLYSHCPVDDVVQINVVPLQLKTLTNHAFCHFSAHPARSDGRRGCWYYGEHQWWRDCWTLPGYSQRNIWKQCRASGTRKQIVFFLICVHLIHHRWKLCFHTPLLQMVYIFKLPHWSIFPPLKVGWIICQCFQMGWNYIHGMRSFELCAIQLFTGPSSIIMETPQKHVLLFLFCHGSQRKLWSPVGVPTPGRGAPTRMSQQGLRVTTTTLWLNPSHLALQYQGPHR